MKTETSIVIKDWPVLPVKETNRQRIVRALREATVPQCYGSWARGEARCALGVMDDAFEIISINSLERRFGLIIRLAPLHYWNDSERLTFAQIADRLDSDEYWSEHADEEFKDGS